jgi:hypothetical protein
MTTFDELDKLTTQSASRDHRPIMTPEQLEEAWAIILGNAKSHPAFKQFAARWKYKMKIEHPWQAIGHKLFASMECMLGAQGKLRVIGTQPDSNAHMMTMVAGLLGEAATYLWQPEIEKLADAAPLPTHVLSRSIMSSPTMFWSISEPTTATSWTGLIHATTDIIVVGEGATDEGDACLGLRAIPYGKTWPHDFRDAEDFHEIGLILKRCAFLNSPYVDAEKHGMPRHQRRQLQREGERPERVAETISVVKLRRAAKPQAKPTTTPGEHPGIEYKHQWWVSHHYRAQWYPSEQAHRVIWIAPYLKGPEGAPILEKTYAVVR